MTSKTPEAPTPFLIGNYGYTYYRLDADPSEEFLLRRKRAELRPLNFKRIARPFKMTIQSTVRASSIRLSNRSVPTFR